MVATQTAAARCHASKPIPKGLKFPNATTDVARMVSQTTQPKPKESVRGTRPYGGDRCQRRQSQKTAPTLRGLSEQWSQPLDAGRSRNHDRAISLPNDFLPHRDLAMSRRIFSNDRHFRLPLPGGECAPTQVQATTINEDPGPTGSTFLDSATDTKERRGGR